MTSQEIRNAFLDFFKSKTHSIVPSAPMVLKNDPTLMFTNAGMNQFKDIFLGNADSKSPRVADSQKCLRVSGKHNDLEEVGHDTYHHTMFEMLGNWSFGDYFKEDAINWAWEFLTETLQIDKSKLYATVFEGSKEDGTELDVEAQKLWQNFLPDARILNGNKKDNFWEMGETGPCGPCSEIHIDLRSDEEIAKIPGRDLVNEDHPLVIEIWNLVFIQFNRKKGGKLELLPAKHIDTGMGFERLAMVVQGTKSNYDTDVFMPIISSLEKITSCTYKKVEKTDIAIRVIADHIRTISFSITDGQLPSNTGAGYVIRRILRRAVRYGYTFLNAKEPFMHKLLPALISVMGEQYPELISQKDIIEKVIYEEENSFLRTLETGIKLLDKVISVAKAENKSEVDGKTVFVLYDTYGFPYDLTDLILSENGLKIDKPAYEKAMLEQKTRSQDAASTDTDDWTELIDDKVQEFIGYDYLETELRITRYRKITEKKETFYHLIFNFTPFYAESGGQVGDTGYIEANGEKIFILDTQKEHNVTIHKTEKLPSDLSAKFKASVNPSSRELSMCNHSATHIMHKILRDMLGNHVEQKGSLVDETKLRFDFSHFQKLTAEEIRTIEEKVNSIIRQNISLEERRDVPMSVADDMGAMALFGEKYGDLVRVIKFGDSVELCGGTHVKATGQIGFFKIISESAIAAGIRRIEAITSAEAEKFVYQNEESLNSVKAIFKNPKNLTQSAEKIVEENRALKKQIEKFEAQHLQNIQKELKNSIKVVNGVNTITGKIALNNAGQLRDLAFRLNGEVENLFFACGIDMGGKANFAIMLADNLVKDKGLNAGKIIREVSRHFQGGGGGQANFASAGGKNPDGIGNAAEAALELL